MFPKLGTSPRPAAALGEEAAGVGLKSEIFRFAPSAGSQQIVGFAPSARCALASGERESIHGEYFDAHALYALASAMCCLWFLRCPKLGHVAPSALGEAAAALGTANTVVPRHGRASRRIPHRVEYRRVPVVVSPRCRVAQRVVSATAGEAGDGRCRQARTAVAKAVPESASQNPVRSAGSETPLERVMDFVEGSRAVLPSRRRKRSQYASDRRRRGGRSGSSPRDRLGLGPYGAPAASDRRGRRRKVHNRL